MRVSELRAKYFADKKAAKPAAVKAEAMVNPLNPVVAPAVVGTIQSTNSTGTTTTTITGIGNGQLLVAADCAAAMKLNGHIGYDSTHVITMTDGTRYECTDEQFAKWQPSDALAVVKVNGMTCKKVKFARATLAPGQNMVTFQLANGRSSSGRLLGHALNVTIHCNGVPVTFPVLLMHDATTTGGDCGSLGFQGAQQAVCSHIGTGTDPENPGRNVNFAVPCSN
jgi:hypothetical protein